MTNNKLFMIILFSLCLIMLNCTGSETQNKGYKATTKMIVPNSNKSIVKFVDFGEFAFSDWHYATVILDTTENLLFDKKNKIPNGLISKFDMKSNTIELIQLVDLKEKKKAYNQEVDGITFKVKNYKTKRGSNIGLWYNYRNFLETSDSIIFENVKVETFGIPLPNRISFAKGNITAKEDTLGYVTEINIQIVNQYPLSEKLGEMNVGDTLDMEKVREKFKGKHQIDLAPLSLVYEYNLCFKPDSLSKKQTISNIGIFKNVEN